MRKILGLAMALLVGSAGTGSAQGVYYQGHTNHNGTYVQPHYQSAPDHNYNNNWGVSPNVNPYTGQMGTHQPTYNGQPPNPYGYR